MVAAASLSSMPVGTSTTSIRCGWRPRLTGPKRPRAATCEVRRTWVELRVQSVRANGGHAALCYRLGPRATATLASAFGPSAFARLALTGSDPSHRRPRHRYELCAVLGEADDSVPRHRAGGPRASPVSTLPDRVGSCVASHGAFRPVVRVDRLGDQLVPKRAPARSRRTACERRATVPNHEAICRGRRRDGMTLRS